MDTREIADRLADIARTIREHAETDARRGNSNSAAYRARIEDAELVEELLEQVIDSTIDSKTRGAIERVRKVVREMPSPRLGHFERVAALAAQDAAAIAPQKISDEHDRRELGHAMRRRAQETR